MGGCSPLSISNGRPWPQGRQLLLSVPFSSSPLSCAAGSGLKTSEGPREVTPSSWTSFVTPQVGLNPSPTKTPDFPGPCLPNSRSLGPLLPRTGGSALPPGGLPCQRLTSSQSPPSMDFLSCPIPSCHRLSTTVDTSPTASVGFLAAGGIPSAVNPFPTGPAPSWNSGNPASPRLIRHPTLSSAGAPGLACLPERLPISLQWSPRLSGTAPPAHNRAPGRAEPSTRTPSSSPQSLSTSPRRKSALSGDRKAATGPQSGQASTPNDGRAVPHSSLEAYYMVSSTRPGSVYGLRVVF